MTRPLYASETTAARLLDMRPAEFRAHVDAGDFPPGIEIAPGVIRWKTATLENIASGAAINGGMQW